MQRSRTWDLWRWRLRTSRCISLTCSRQINRISHDARDWGAKDCRKSSQLNCGLRATVHKQFAIHVERQIPVKKRLQSEGYLLHTQSALIIIQKRSSTSLRTTKDSPNPNKPPTSTCSSSACGGQGPLGDGDASAACPHTAGV